MHQRLDGKGKLGKEKEWVGGRYFKGEQVNLYESGRVFSSSRELERLKAVREQEVRASGQGWGRVLESVRVRSDRVRLAWDPGLPCTWSALPRHSGIPLPLSSPALMSGPCCAPPGISRCCCSKGSPCGRQAGGAAKA